MWQWGHLGSNKASARGFSFLLWMNLSFKEFLVSMKIRPLAPRICTRWMRRNGGGTLQNVFYFHCPIAFLKTPASSLPSGMIWGNARTFLSLITLICTSHLWFEDICNVKFKKNPCLTHRGHILKWQDWSIEYKHILERNIVMGDENIFCVVHISRWRPFSPFYFIFTRNYPFPTKCLAHN